MDVRRCDVHGQARPGQTTLSLNVGSEPRGKCYLLQRERQAELSRRKPEDWPTAEETSFGCVLDFHVIGRIEAASRPNNDPRAGLQSREDAPEAEVN